MVNSPMAPATPSTADAADDAAATAAAPHSFFLISSLIAVSKPFQSIFSFLQNSLLKQYLFEVPQPGELGGKVPGVGELGRKVPGVGELGRKVPRFGEVWSGEVFCGGA